MSLPDMWEKMERSFQVAVLDTPSSCSTRFLAEHFLMKELRLPWGHLEFSHGTSRFPIFAEHDMLDLEARGFMPSGSSFSTSSVASR